MILGDERVAAEAMAIFSELQASDEAYEPFTDAIVASSFAIKQAVARGEYPLGSEAIHREELGSQILKALHIDEESSFKKRGE